MGCADRPGDSSLSRAHRARAPAWPSAQTANAWPALPGSGRLKVWDAQTGQELLTLKGGRSQRGLQPGRQTPGQRLEEPRGQGVGCPDRPGTPLPQGAPGQITAVRLQPGRQTSGQAGPGGDVRVWDAQTGQELLTFQGHTSLVTSVVFSPDGTRLASARHGWDGEDLGCDHQSGSPHLQRTQWGPRRGLQSRWQTPGRRGL